MLLGRAAYCNESLAWSVTLSLPALAAPPLTVVDVSFTDEAAATVTVTEPRSGTISSHASGDISVISYSKEGRAFDMKRISKGL